MSAFSALLVLAVSVAANDAVLVEFHSQNCSPCRAMQPVMQKLADEGYPLQQIDVDQQQNHAKHFQIRSLPTFVLFHRGREVQRTEGSTSHAELAAMFHKVGFAPAVQSATAQQTQFVSTPAEISNQSRPAQGTMHDTAHRVMQLTPQQRAGYATVRLKIEDDRGFSFGTGTIIDRHDDEALVMTCGHIFRSSQGKGKISVDLFAPGASQPVAGQVIAYDLDRDIALVSIRPGITIEPVPVAPADYAVQPRDRVFTIGCDKGANPSLRNSLINTVNKYHGAPNFTADGTPVEGRSGGGLFTESGYLIGICNAADEKANEGLYAALASVHWQLDQIGQSAIYQKNGAKGPAANIAAANNPEGNTPEPPSSVIPAPRSLSQPPSMPTVMPAGFNQPTDRPALNQFAGSAAQNAGGPTASGATADDTEVIVIVRSRSNPTKQSEIFVMDRPPIDIIRQLQLAGRPAAQGSSQDLLRSAARFGPQGEFSPTDGSPIVRGQSQ